jgi:hypothetical protein
VTDLAEREEIVDRRARQASIKLHTEARNSNRSRGLALLIATAVVVGALVITLHRQSDQVVTTAGSTAYWVIDGLPGDWSSTPYTTSRETLARATTNSRRATVFGTSLAPLGPLVAVYRAPPNGPVEHPAEVFSSTNFSEATSAGRRVVFADTSNGQRVAWVEIDDEWLVALSQELSDGKLLTLLGGVTIAPDGMPAINTAAVPGDLTYLGVGNLSDLAPVTSWWGGPATVALLCESPDRRSSVMLTTGPSTQSELALFGLDRSKIRSFVAGGQNLWIVEGEGTPEAPSMVIWQSREITFQLTSASEPADDLVQLVGSIRAATASEVKRFPTAGRVGDSDPPETEVPGVIEAPAETDPPPSIEPSADRKTLGLELVSVEPSDYELQLTGQLPDGFGYTVEFVVVAGQLRVRMKPIDENSTTMSIGEVPVDGSPQWTLLQGGASQPAMSGVAMATLNASAQYLEVLRSNGESYRTALTSTAANPNIRFSAIVVPGGELVRASILDTEGRVLDELDGP